MIVTHPVESTIFSSKGSPSGCPFIRVMVWQQASPCSMGPGGRSWGSRTSSENPAAPPSVTPQTSMPSSVRVPVWSPKKKQKKLWEMPGADELQTKWTVGGFILVVESLEPFPRPHSAVRLFNLTVLWHISASTQNVRAVKNWQILLELVWQNK